MNNKNEIEIDLQRVFAVCLESWWKILLSGFIVGIIVMVITMNFITPLYRSSVLLYVNSMRRDGEIVESISSSELTTSQKLVTTYINILSSDMVMKKIKETARVEDPLPILKSHVTATQQNGTEILEVMVSDVNPQKAAKIANAVALVAPEAIAGVVQGSSVSIIDYANVPDAPYTPNVQKNTLIGIIIGMMVMIVYIVISDLMDVRIKSEADIKAEWGIPVLGQIPDFMQEEQRGKYGYEHKYAYEHKKE